MAPVLFTFASRAKREKNTFGEKKLLTLLFLGFKNVVATSVDVLV